VVPKFGFRSARGVVTFFAMLVAAAAAITQPALVIFPALFGYVAFGVLRSVVLGHLERLPERDPMLDTEGDEDEAGAEVREIEYADLTPQHRAHARWRGTGNGE
jgi:CDP-diacylglycerol--serine O-phosphatidyltransferase